MAVDTDEPARRVLTAEFDPLNNRVGLVFSPAPGTCAYATFQTSRDGGVRWYPVRAGYQLPLVEGVCAVYDYEAPLNTLSWYRVASYYQRGELTYLYTDYTTAVAVTPRIPDERWWAKDV
jgi:hypothetical protein